MRMDAELLDEIFPIERPRLIKICRHVLDPILNNNESNIAKKDIGNLIEMRAKGQEVNQIEKYLQTVNPIHLAIFMKHIINVRFLCEDSGSMFQEIEERKNF